MLATCNALFFTARHYFPYDLALMFFLIGLNTGLKPGYRSALIAGAITAIGFMCYNGYWWFGGVGLVLCTLKDAKKPDRTVILRAVFGFSGLVGTIALAIGIRKGIRI